MSNDDFDGRALRIPCYVRPVFRGLITLCGCALLLLSAPATALAYEDQITLGVGLGYANAVSDSLPASGVLADVAVSYGLSSVWTLRGRVSYALHPDDRTMHVLLTGGELLYMIDVVEVVPYFGLGVDALSRFRADDSHVDPALHGVVGLDYLCSRDVALGIDARVLMLPTELDHDPLYIAATASVTWMFDR
jgi:hypothetical protein